MISARSWSAEAGADIASERRGITLTSVGRRRMTREVELTFLVALEPRHTSISPPHPFTPSNPS